MERAYLRRADAFIFNSRTTRDSVARVLGGTPRGIVAYPGRDRLPADISAPDIARRVRQSPPLRLLFVGNIIPRKRVHILLNALAALPADCAALKLVGCTDADPRYFRQMQSLATQLRLTDRVQFLGRLPDAELTPLLRDSHLLAVPSGYEGFGIVYLEAMGFGVPVIAGVRGGAREIVTPGANGFLVDDVRSVAAILRDLCENRQKLAQMSLAAQARQRQFPAWDDSMAHIRAFLLELTEAR